MREQDIPVVRIYAEALADAASAQQGRAEALYDEAVETAALLGGRSDLLCFLQRPAVALGEKRALLGKVFGGRVSPLILHLGQLLVDKFRGGLWRAVLEEYVRLIDERRNVFTAEVFTAHELPGEDRARLQQRLEAFTGKSLRVKFVRRAELLGGVLFRYGDTMIDYTLRRFLDEARDRLRAVKVD